MSWAFGRPARRERKWTKPKKAKKPRLTAEEKAMATLMELRRVPPIAAENAKEAASAVDAANDGDMGERV